MKRQVLRVCYLLLRAASIRASRTKTISFGPLPLLLFFKFAVCAVAGGAICITQNSLEVGNSDIIVPPHWAVGGVLLWSHEDYRCHSD